MFTKYLEYQLTANSVILVNMSCIFHFIYSFFPVLVKLLWFYPCCLSFGLLWAEALPSPSGLAPPPPAPAPTAGAPVAHPRPSVLQGRLRTAVRYSFKKLLFHTVTVIIFSLLLCPFSSSFCAFVRSHLSAFIPVVLLPSPPALILQLPVVSPLLTNHSPFPGSSRLLLLQDSCSLFLYSSFVTC